MVTAAAEQRGPKMVSTSAREFAQARPRGSSPNCCSLGGSSPFSSSTALGLPLPAPPSSSTQSTARDSSSMSTSRSCNSSRAQYSARANASIWPSAVPKPSASDALLVTDADVEAVGGGLPAAAPTSGGGGPLSQGEIKIIQRALRASTADGEKQPLSRAAVEVGLTLLHVERLDPSEGTFAADFKLHCRWRDRAFEADADMASLRWKGAFANGVVAAHHRPGEAWPECVVKPLDPELVDRSRPRVDVRAPPPPSNGPPFARRWHTCILAARVLSPEPSLCDTAAYAAMECAAGTQCTTQCSRLLPTAPDCLQCSRLLTSSPDCLQLLTTAYNCSWCAAGAQRHRGCLCRRRLAALLPLSQRRSGRRALH